MIHDAIIVGAGPAGSAAATILARCGRRVLLLEKDRLPRRKVCGAFLSGDAAPLLDRLGVREAIEACAPERIREGSVEIPGGRSISFQLPAAAIGLSRFILDDLLARHAAETGAQLREGARVLSADRIEGLFRVALAGHQTEILEARVVIGAWGRWDALDRSLRRAFLEGRRFFAWNRDFQGDSEVFAGRVRLYLFRGGYCGLSRVEHGRVNLAGVVSEETWAAAGSSWDCVLDRARGDNPRLDGDLALLEPGPAGFLGTGPVFFTAKPPVEGGVLMAGDAAGVLDLFSGAGQSAALSSGILAAECIEAALSQRIPMAHLSRSYARAWRARFRPAFAWSAFLRRLMLHPRLARAAGRLAGGRLAEAATRSFHPKRPAA